MPTLASSTHTTFPHMFRHLKLGFLSLGTYNTLIVLHTALPLLVLRNLAEAHVAASVLVDIGKVDGRNERLALPCLGDYAVELVDLFERETLCLVDHEIAILIC